MARYELNDERNEIEIYFDSAPSEEIRMKLRKSGWRWFYAKKCWNTRQSEKSIELAKELCGETIELTGVVMPEMKKRYCYADSITNFLKTTQDEWIEEMKSGFSKAYVFSLGKPQIDAWEDCYKVLKRELKDFASKYPEFYIIFEYALPYESGRRPDVLLISNEFVIVLEFKMKNKILRADFDQLAAYAKDLKEYHFESRNKEILAMLVVTKISNKEFEKRGISICSGDRLEKILSEKINNKVTVCAIEEWINSRYEPLPTIVDAARMIMKKEELPNIRKVNSTGIPNAISMLEEITEYAKDEKKHILALVTGVPGAGKTFLGLQYVYRIHEKIPGVNSVYLSGNRPLVHVLTDALKSNTFVKSIRNIEDEYLQKGAYDFNKNVIVFDEGQRAWNKQQMANKKRGHNVSEPDVMIKLAEDRLEWCVLMVLVGEGQEIHNGESTGISQWNDALNNSDICWEVVCPDKLSHIFEKEQKMIEGKNNDLDLTVSLRTHLSGDVSNFVNSIISGNVKEAKELTEKILNAGFTMLITRDIEEAKDYCRTRYDKNIDKRYGMLQSSKAQNLEGYGIKCEYTPNWSAWYNTPLGSGKSCCDFELAFSEFDCQGLELDMPIVCWDTDMTWNGPDWNLYAKREAANSDSNIYRKNSYRVLLTRGRDGFIIFVPDIPKLNSVYELFLDIGIEKLKR